MSINVNTLRSLHLLLTTGMVHVPLTQWEQEDATKEMARNVLQSSITFDDLDQWAEGRKSKRLLQEAMYATRVLAHQTDAQLHKLSLKHKDNPKFMRTLWKMLTGRVDRPDGFDDVEKTIFETMTQRTPVYDEPLTDPLVRAYPGFIKKDRKLGWLSYQIDHNLARAIAFGWLEGDDSIEPLNKPKTRHRENGDWILVFDHKYFPGLDYRVPTVTITVDKRVFEEHAIEDRENGIYERVTLRRGAKPDWMKEGLTEVEERWIDNLKNTDDVTTVQLEDIYS